jgi:hypothetical protein
MSGTFGTGDLTRVVLALQELIKASYLTQTTLAGGIAINTTLSATTAAGLPATAPLGQLRYVTNGRGPGEGAGAGTGCIVAGSGSIWRAIWSGALVTT